MGGSPGPGHPTHEPGCAASTSEGAGSFAAASTEATVGATLAIPIINSGSGRNAATQVQLIRCLTPVPYDSDDLPPSLPDSELHDGTVSPASSTSNASPCSGAYKWRTFVKSGVLLIYSNTRERLGFILTLTLPHEESGHHKYEQCGVVYRTDTIRNHVRGPHCLGLMVKHGVVGSMGLTVSLWL